MSKASLIVGGNGALGRSVVTAFKRSGWRVASMDLVSNGDADKNIVIQKDHSLKDQLVSIKADCQAFSKEYDSIICVAGGFGISNIKDANILEAYEEQDRINFQPALMTAHLATEQLSAQGMLMFTGAAAVFEGPVNFAYAYYIAKSATHSLALQMSERKEIPESASVITILPQVIDTPANREAMPNEDHSKWAPPTGIATMINQWAAGENRPENGSFAKILYGNGVVHPEFL